jgi:DNA-directed RNA polymerase subunit H (RpoH/RPB5)
VIYLEDLVNNRSNMLSINERLEKIQKAIEIIESKNNLSLKEKLLLKKLYIQKNRLERISSDDPNIKLKEYMLHDKKSTLDLILTTVVDFLVAFFEAMLFIYNEKKDKF